MDWSIDCPSILKVRILSEDVYVTYWSQILMHTPQMTKSLYIDFKHVSSSISVFAIWWFQDISSFEVVIVILSTGRQRIVFRAGPVLTFTPVCARSFLQPPAWLHYHWKWGFSLWAPASDYSSKGRRDATSTTARLRALVSDDVMHPINGERPESAFKSALLTPNTSSLDKSIVQIDSSHNV